MIKKRCNMCIQFDCGIRCRCDCHKGTTPVIRQDHSPQSEGLLLGNKTEEQAMEGLSALFG